MRYFLFSLLFVGCCTVPTVQTVQLADTLHVPNVSIEFTGRGQIVPIYVTDTIQVSDTGKIVQRLATLNASKDTTLYTLNGSISLLARYQYPKNEWYFKTSYRPNPILPGTEVSAVVGQKKPSWKETYFWQFVIPLFVGSSLFFFTLIAFIRKVK
jgi:hypothetical protein